MFDTNLAHYGILGMRWGRRRGSMDTGGSPKPKRKRAEEMTDDELRAANNRLGLERQYKELTKRQISSGEKVVTEILLNAAKKQATQYVSKVMGAGVDAALTKAGVDMSIFKGVAKAVAKDIENDK